MDGKSFRIKYNQDKELDHINLNLNQEYDFLEILSLKIKQEDVYKVYTSNYGVLVGRVLANDGFGIPNVKVSIFVKSKDFKDSDKYNLYPYSTTKSKNDKNIRYNLLPSEKTNECHQPVGSINSKRTVLDNNILIEIFDDYYKYTTVTNESGDYMFFNIPTGLQEIHADVDLSDIGVLSQAPRDMFYKGYNLKQFDSPNKFKKSTNLDILPQIISEDTTVFVYPFWGDETQSDVSITKKNINIQYKFEPTCVFMGSVFTDSMKSGIKKNCRPAKDSGVMSEMTTSQGSIEMLRQSIDGKIEKFSINGDRLINDDGVWCYQIPMNLDYVITDEYGNTIPTQDPNKGIPTRAKVRFRVSMDDSGDSFVQSKTASYLIPNNPKTKSDEDYTFDENSNINNFVDLLWNKVYSVKNYIPRIVKSSFFGNIATDRKFTGLKGINYHGSNNPTPYNNIFVDLNLRFILLCTLTQFILKLVGLINKYIIAPLKYVSWVNDKVRNISPIVLNVNMFGQEISECIKNKFGSIVEFLVPQFQGGKNDELSTYQKSMAILHALSQIKGDTYLMRNTVSFCLDGYDGGGFINTFNGKWELQIKDSGDNEGLLIGCSSSPDLYNYLDISSGHVEQSGIYKWYRFKDNFVAFEATNRVENLTSDVFDCIETELSSQNEVVNFDFSNDWINGSLYLPKFLTKIKKNRKTGKIKYTYCGSWKENYYNNLYLVQTCAVQIDKTGNFPPNNTNKKCYENGECYKKSYEKRIGAGNINRVDSEDVYYYRAIEYQSISEHDKYIHPTGIILLGSLNGCDMDGIPQLHRLLPQTSFKLPPNSFEPDEDAIDFENEIVNNDSEVYKKSMSGIDWGNKTNNQYNYENGLFVSVSCSDSDTIVKSCVNASRICEIGVDFDEKFTGYTGNISDIKYIDGFISNDEVSDGDARAMFATLNGNDLTVQSNEYNHRKYYFNYSYPNTFDGRLYTTGITNGVRYGLESDYILNENGRKDYYNFRFGIKNNQNLIGYDYSGNYSFPRYENSFYFYFGLKPGATAIDVFNSQYFVPCDEVKESPFYLKVTEYEKAGICSKHSGKLNIEIKDALFPCNVYINDYLYETTNSSNLIVSGLTQGYYNVKVIDSNGTSVSGGDTINRKDILVYNYSYQGPTGIENNGILNIYNIFNENRPGSNLEFKLYKKLPEPNLYNEYELILTQTINGNEYNITNLGGGNYYFTIIEIDCIYNNQTSYFDLYSKPVIGTLELLSNSLAQESATLSCSVTSDGGNQITSRGVCWSESINPTIDNNKLIVPGTTGYFVEMIYPLQPETTYYARAYAENSGGVTYSNQVMFTTLALTVPGPMELNSYIWDIDKIITTGNIYNDGGSAIISSGIKLLSGSTEPNINDLKNNGIIYEYPDKTLNGEITNLAGSTTYYIIPYSVNSIGTGYTDNFYTVYTFAGPTIGDINIASESTTTITTMGDIISTGDGLLEEWGFYYSSNPSDYQTMNGIITNGIKFQLGYSAEGVDISGGEFNGYITGLTPNTYYAIIAYAKNKNNITTYNQTIPFGDTTINGLVSDDISININIDSSFGGNQASPVDDDRFVVSGITELIIPYETMEYKIGVCYSENQTPTINDNIQIQTTVYSGNIEFKDAFTSNAIITYVPTPGPYNYYVRAMITDINNNLISYGNIIQVINP